MKQKIDSSQITDYFLSYLKTLDKKQWEVKITNKWDVHDTVAHIVGWLEEVSNILPKSWENKEEPWFMKTDDYAQFNQKNVEKYKNLKPTDLISKYVELNNKLNILIDKIGEKNIKLDQRFRWVLDDGENNHELYHFNQIKEKLET